ncbi:hypothetical protein KAR91_34280 [Candidatus Pacearchaeota archaeon]|nr:hypothetical protein [Candidatus Pacearchaeota archaeon]
MNISIAFNFEDDKGPVTVPGEFVDEFMALIKKHGMENHTALFVVDVAGEIHTFIPKSPHVN